MLKRFFFGGVIVDRFLPELILFLVRVFAGLTMAFAHGYGKLPPSEQFLARVTEMGFPMASAFAWAATFSEFVGGLLLAVGLFTRPAALCIAGTMLVAGFMAHATDPFNVKERALLFLALALVYLALGGGRFSLDRYLGQGKAVKPSKASKPSKPTKR